jgi:aryl-alcohol dehydrogenase-like predicted oxidoreductase
MVQRPQNLESSRLVLGTVQLGMKYGVANKTGQPDQKIAADIIKVAWDHGICEFDTAQGYGNSEKVLGKIFLQLGIIDKVRVISKFHSQLDHLNRDVLLTALDESLMKLRVPALHGILLHDEKLLAQWEQGVGENLKYCVNAGKIKKIGVSVYSVKNAMTALQIPEIDLIQLPANIFDHRFEQAGFFEQAKEKNKQIYIRSVFLQGLLLMKPSDLPVHLLGVQNYLEQLALFCRQRCLTPRDVALGYIGAQMPEAKVIFGVETVEQLRENLTSWYKNLSVTIGQKVRELFLNLPEELINPVLWKN